MAMVWARNPTKLIEQRGLVRYRSSKRMAVEHESEAQRKKRKEKFRAEIDELIEREREVLDDLDE